jgi:hypothetical protein
MKYRIAQIAGDLYLQSTIDSSGMDVFWTSKAQADVFETKEEAEKLAQRVLSRFPSAGLRLESE